MFKQDQPGKIDKRHGDPEAGGKTSGQKAVSVYSFPFRYPLGFLVADADIALFLCDLDIIRIPKSCLPLLKNYITRF